MTAEIKVLIVTGSDKGVSLISQLLDSSVFYPVSSVKSGTEARRALLGGEYDAVVINTPLPDEFGHDLAVHISEKTSSGVVLLVKNELFDQVSSKVEDYGILTIGKPIQRPMFNQAMKMLAANKNRLNRYETENRKLQTKIEEIKVISRAKCILVEYLRMTEAQAHHYIEKQAMDMRTSRKNVAEGILKTYDV